MLFSYNWLKEYIKGKVPEPKKLAEILTFHSFEVEGVTKKKGDWILDISVLPNRAHDCFSHLGVAREAAVLTGCKFVEPEVKIKEDKKIKAKDLINIEVKDKTDCPRYTATVITDVKAGDSPKWLKERLQVCGLQAINNIVDAANYVMLELGQPIHAFDLDKVGKKITIRRASKDEEMAALDDKTYQLDKDILVIADTQKPIAIAGIKGGEATGINKKTKTIVIEAANFDPVLTRTSSRKLKLKTDASIRFEQGIDVNLIDYAQQRVCALITELAGGKTAQGMVDFFPKKPGLKTITLDLAYVSRLLGIALGKEKIRSILEHLGFQCLGSGLINFKVVVPSRRLDVQSSEDLIEEIGRVAGYDKIPSLPPKADLTMPERNDEIVWENKAKDILKGAGFSETYNYSFCSNNIKDIFYFNENDLVEVANPVSALNVYLRPSLMPNLLKITKENLKNFEQVQLFEIGRVFTKGPLSKSHNLKVKEKTMLSGILAGKRINDQAFFELKGAVDSLLRGLGITDAWYDDVKATPEDSSSKIWHPGKTAEIKAGSQEIGFLGEIHPQIRERLNIKTRLFVFDINFEQLLTVASEENEYQPVSSYPSSIRDIAVLVPEGTKVSEVLNVINQASGELIKDVDLFDAYSGQGIAQGMENLAFHIVYQSADHTLSSAEIDKAHQKIVKALEQNAEWEVRK